MDVYDTYYGMIRRLMTFLGVWPFQDSKEQFPRQVFFTIFIGHVVITEFITLFTMDMTLTNVVEMMTAIIPTLSFSSAYLVSIIHYDGMKCTFERITYDWAHISSLEELEIMKGYANQTRLYISAFAILMYGSNIMILGPPILFAFLGSVGVMNGTETQELPVHLEYYLDKEKYFYILLLHQIIAVLILNTCAVAIYSMFFVIVQHACSVFRVISAPKKTDVWVYNCIYRYTKATEFVATINDSVEMCYLNQIAMSMLIVSISILHVFQISREYTGFADLMRSCSCIPGPIACNYITCYVGQRLIDHSGEVFRAACQLSYYDTTQKVQKLLLFLLMRTAKPSSLSIGKMFVSSHEFFMATMQTSFSYAMVLYTLN